MGLSSQSSKGVNLMQCKVQTSQGLAAYLRGLNFKQGQVQTKWGPDA